MADRMLTLEEVQDIIQVGRTTLYRLVKAKELPARKVGRQWRISESCLREWMREREDRGIPCWELKGCSGEERRECIVYRSKVGAQ